MEARGAAGAFYKLLSSKKLALVTIGLLTLFSVIGMVKGFEKVFSSWWFIIVSLVFLINLSLCTLLQLLKAWKTGFNLSVWGKTIFHTGLVLIVIGGFVSTGFKTTGYMMLGEGESRQEKHEFYSTLQEGKLFQETMHEGFQITLLKQNPVYDSNKSVDYISSSIEIRDGNVSRQHWVEKGSPMVYKNFRLFHYNSGYAPGIVIKSKSGQQIFGTYLLLNTQEEGEKARHYVTKQQLPGTPYYVDLEYYPDAKIKEGKISSRSESPDNPAAKVRVYKGNNRIAEGILSREKSVSLEGNTLEMTTEIKRWVGLEIVNDPGASLLFLGCWVALFGVGFYFVPGLRLKVKEA